MNLLTVFSPDIETRVALLLHRVYPWKRCRRPVGREYWVPKGWR